VTHHPEARRGVWKEEMQLKVSGPEAHLPRRVQDWFKREARRRFTERLQHYREAVAGRTGKLRLTDTKSRWGSCAANGTISLSWRLICTPVNVQEYVLAHEAAHLREPHHGPAFWRLVEELVPQPKADRAWLRQHGLALQRMGLRPS